MLLAASLLRANNTLPRQLLRAQGTNHCLEKKVGAWRCSSVRSLPGLALENGQLDNKGDSSLGERGQILPVSICLMTLTCEKHSEGAISGEKPGRSFLLMSSLFHIRTSLMR